MTFPTPTHEPAKKRSAWHPTVILSVMAGVLLAVTSAACGTSRNTDAALATHATCVAGVTRTTLVQFESFVHFHVNCADIYDDAAPDWAAWQSPWFIGNQIPADNWVPFAKQRDNQLTITLGLIPQSVYDADPNWRALGAAGDFTGYARTLARHLIAGHMSSSVIRLATEANGTWEKDSLGSTPAQWEQWKEFWRKTALAMGSVPGAHFSFLWGISNGYRSIPFSDYYPGNDVVSLIGDDVYDNAPAHTANRFVYVRDEHGGLSAIARFSRRHHRPLIIPEWGLEPTSGGGGGDDPAFVAGLARFVRSDHVASNAYFFDGNTSAELKAAPASLKVLRSDLSAPSEEK